MSKLTDEQRECLDTMLTDPNFHVHFHRDDPKITVIEKGPGTLITIRVEYTDEQMERIRNRPQRGYQFRSTK